PSQIEWSEDFINMLGKNVVEEVINKDGVPFAIHKKNYWEKYGDEVKKAYAEILKKEKIPEKDIQDVINNTSVRELLLLIKDAANYLKNGAFDITMQDDIVATNQAIRKAVSDKEYRAWIDSLFKGIEEKAGIRNDKDRFTSSGNRRSFEALHYENNLENVIRAMKKQGEKGVGEFGTGRIFGASTKNFSSIEDIKDAANKRLKNVSAKEYESIKENFTNRFSEIAQSIPINKNSFEAFDDAANMLIEAVSKNKTKKSIADYIQRESKGWAYYSENVVDDLVELVADIRNMPTTYFEAKPNRAVGFEEVAMAIVPNDTNAETIERLKNNGIPYIEYEAGNEESRKNVLNSLENVRFSTGSSFDEMAGEAKAEHGVSESVSAEISDSAKRVIEQMRPRKPKVQSSTSQVNPETESTNPVEVPQSEKSKRIERRYQRAVEEGVASVFGIDRSDIKNDIRPVLDEIAKDVKDGNKITDEQIERLYKTAFDNGYITEEFPQYDEIRKYIRSAPVFVDEKTRHEFGDHFEFRDFARKNFGSIKFTTDPKARHLDEFFDNLSSMEPDFFDGFETDPKTQLESISDFMNQTKKQYYGLSEVYSGTELSDFENWAKKELKAYMDEFGKGLDNVRRYERDRQIKATNKAREIDRTASFEQAKAAFEDNKVFDARKVMEAVKKSTVLSDSELVEVKRLHEGTLTEGDVIALGGNVEGILEVYNAEKAYKAARAPFDRYKAAYKTAMQHDAIKATELSDEWNDKKIGFLYSRETAERNVKDIAGKGGKKVIEEYFEPIHENEAMKTRWIREMNQRVAGLELGKMNQWERAYAQMIGENAAYIASGRITKHNQFEHDLLNSKIHNLLAEHGNKIDKAKCEKAAAGFMEIYEDILEEWNDERIRRGQEPLGKIENYFPHFTETKPENTIQKIFSFFGFDINSSKLPTDIAGRTADRKPNTKYNPHAMRRKGDITDYDIFKGFDGYVRAVGDNIFHTEDIQKIRALSDTIRTKYSSAEIEKRIEDIRNRQDLSEEDKEALISEAFKSDPGAYHLSNFVVWLDEYANILAGKKSRGDRETEYQMGREIYDISKAIEGRIASNMIGYNLSTPVMNLVPMFQATADVSPVDIVSSFIQTGVAAARGDSFISDNSDFLTNRFGTDSVYKKNYNLFTSENMKDAVAKIQDGGAFLMEFVDRIAAESLVRARYQQNLKNGMDKVSAFSEADQWAAGLM
ncbi:MAG: hypothetical protein IKU42_06975, partial [Oscillospiraceae bacterium]|nr:hypothetical protein [Oscillospiraceae bacterium]